jgi:chromosome segregation ATPase
MQTGAEGDMRNVLVAGFVGLVLGGTLAWANMFSQLQPALQEAAKAKSARAEAVQNAKKLEDELKDRQLALEKSQTAGKAAEQALKEARDQLAGLTSAKQAAEKAADDLKGQLAAAKGQLAAAESAKQAAERAAEALKAQLTEAKKSAPSQ